MLKYPVLISFCTMHFLVKERVCEGSSTRRGEKCGFEGEGCGSGEKRGGKEEVWKREKKGGKDEENQKNEKKRKRRRRRRKMALFHHIYYTCPVASLPVHDIIAWHVTEPLVNTNFLESTKTYILLTGYTIIDFYS